MSEAVRSVWTQVTGIGISHSPLRCGHLCRAVRGAACWSEKWARSVPLQKLRVTSMASVAQGRPGGNSGCGQDDLGPAEGRRDPRCDLLIQGNRAY